ncbi:MAG: SurA N-terminal domain-containing protein [Proteobacteria bacterium]|nr:SurA N-terminal domain-containing protein [Pseudomonadota bacterium]
MLTAIRKHTKSIVVKALAGLLVISFAFWGVSDMFTPGSSPSLVFEVGNVEIGPREVEYDIRREINRLRPMLGDQFGVEQARSMGLIESVVQRKINDTAIYLAAKELGVVIKDDLVLAEIRNTPAFQSLGAFDQGRFQQALSQNFMSQNDYIVQVRRRMGRNQILESFSPQTAPKRLVDTVYRHRQEKRTVDTVHIADSAQKGIPEPNSAALEKYHKDNAETFTAPEYRALTVIRLEASDLAKDVEVADGELMEAYEAREDEFTVQESRRVMQMILASEEEAKKAEKALSAGRDFATVALEMAKMNISTVDLGRLTRSGLPFPELVDLVFSLKEGGNSAPVKSPLGWHLFHVTDVEPESTKTLDEVRDDLRKSLALEKAVDNMFELANRLEDLLGGGANLEEAAAQLNLRIVKVAAVDRSALDPAERKVAALPGGDFLSIAFVTEEGADSLLTETGDDGYFVLRVDGVTPRALRPLNTVKAKVAEAWKAEKRAEEAKQSAESVVARVKGGTGLDVIAQEIGLTIKSPPATTRRPITPDPLLFQALIDGIFVLQPGQAAMARNNDGYTVARLKKIVAADPVPDKKGVEQLAGQISDSMEIDVLTQLAGALRERYGVTVNRQAINQLFTGVGGSRRPIRSR